MDTVSHCADGRSMVCRFSAAHCCGCPARVPAQPKMSEVAAVILKGGCRAEPEELRGHLSQKFSRWQLPDAFVFLEEIPRTSVGKFQKSRLREMFAGWERDQTAGGSA